MHQLFYNGKEPMIKTIKCIFHTDTTDTLIIREDRGDFRCYTCGKRGDIKDYPTLLKVLQRFEDTGKKK